MLGIKDKRSVHCLNQEAVGYLAVQQVKKVSGHGCVAGLCLDAFALFVRGCDVPHEAVPTRGGSEKLHQGEIGLSKAPSCHQNPEPLAAGKDSHLRRFQADL